MAEDQTPQDEQPQDDNAQAHGPGERDSEPPADEAAEVAAAPAEDAPAGPADPDAGATAGPAGDDSAPGESVNPEPSRVAAARPDDAPATGADDADNETSAATVDADPEAVAAIDAAGEEDDEPARPRERPAIPGADLAVDIVPEGVDPLAEAPEFGEGDAEIPGTAAAEEDEDTPDRSVQPIAVAAIDLAATARYRATGKRKTAIARVTLRPGTGAYTINGKPLDDYFPRPALQRTIRQPLETVGYEDRMDVVALMHGGGVSAQAGALRHGISRALLEADPNLRGELKRRGFLTRDARAKERKKAGLKKARKRPQFSKR